MHTRTHIVHTTYIDAVVIFEQGVVYDHVVKSHVETAHRPLKHNDTVLTPPPRVKYLYLGSNFEDLTLGIKKSLKFDPPKSLVPPLQELLF